MRRKLFYTLAVIILIAAMLSACSPAATTTGAGTIAGTTAGATKSYLNTTGYPIVNDKLTLTMMVRLDSARGVEPDKNTVWQYLEKMTNIHMNCTVVDTTSWTEKLNLTWASNSLPDIFYNGISMQEIMNYSAIGKLLDMSPYLQTYAPDFYALMQKNKDVKAAVTLPGGKISTFAWTNMEIEPGAGQCPPEYLTINKKWLDKTGQKMPTTAEEFYQVLKAFKEKDANGNGKIDEIGLAPRTGAGDLKKVLAWFGVMANGSDNLFLDGDKVVYAPFTPEYVEAVKYIKKLYTEGLIDKEFFSLTTQQIAAKGSGDDDIYGSIISSAAFAVVGEKKAADFAAAPLFKAPNGDLIWYNRVYANPGVGVISATCKYPEAAVRWCNLFYDVKNVKLCWMGIEGEAYTYNADGTWNWKMRGTDDTTTAIRSQLTLQAGIMGPSMCPTDWFKLNDAVEAPANAQRAQIAKDYFGKLRLPMPSMYYEASNQKKVATLATDLNAYESQSFAEFITGKNDIATGYDAFVKALKQMGAEELVSIAQKTYDSSK